MQSRRFALLAFAMPGMLSIGACARREVTLVEARQIANQRFAAHAHARGVSRNSVPEPTVEVHAHDYVFEYQDEDFVVTVIVARSGEVADRAELKARKT